MLNLTVGYTSGVNRNGKLFRRRYAKLEGMVKIDKRSNAWCYCEWEKRPDGTTVLIDRVHSKDWKEHMSFMRPDFVAPTGMWPQKIQLQLRAIN